PTAAIEDFVGSGGRSSVTIADTSASERRRSTPTRRNRMASIGKQSLLLVVFLFATGLVQVAKAADAPADPCSLLTPAAVSTALGDTFGAPQKSVAPRPFANTVQGTDCHYATANGRHELLFRVYFDHSAAEATDLHARLKMFFGAGSTAAAVGDEAYFDK